MVENFQVGEDATDVGQVAAERLLPYRLAGGLGDNEDNPLPVPDDEQGVLCASFSPDSSKLATAGWDRAIHVWSVKSGQELVAPLRHNDQTVFVSFSRDGSLIASASGDNTARVWDATTGQPTTRPLRHNYAVNKAVFSPDGRFLITMANRYENEKNEVRLWDVATGELAAPPQSLDGYWDPVNSDIVSFSQDGHYALAIWEAKVWTWSLQGDPRPTEDLLQLAQVLSSHAMDASGSINPVEAVALHASFQKPRSKHLQDVAFSPGDVLKWHERQMAAGASDADWFSAGFHADCLLKAGSEDASLQGRRSRYQAELDKLNAKR